jgi:hypothetical protein
VKASWSSLRQKCFGREPAAFAGAEAKTVAISATSISATMRRIFSFRSRQPNRRALSRSKALVFGVFVRRPTLSGQRTTDAPPCRAPAPRADGYCTAPKAKRRARARDLAP